MSTFRLLLILVCFGGVAARAEDSTETEAVGGTVSVEELRNPLEGKALRSILVAQRDLRSGHRGRGMEELRQALADPRAMPYALSMLGSEHLKMGQVDIALGELEEAVRLLPGRPENHSNLAYALGLAGQPGPALLEARKALQLDPIGAKTRFVLARILLDRPETQAEGIVHLKAAAEELPAARLTLTQFYAWKNSQTAEREVQTNHGPSSTAALSFQAPQR